MSITATTDRGTITITAGENYERSYTWAGATRTLEMWPRPERWYGSLGLYYPGPGEHWEKHDGVTRAVAEEGQQHFDTVAEAEEWLQKRLRYEHVEYAWTADGLVVGWGTVPERRQLNAEVWQIYVDGEKPEDFPGADDDRIEVARDEH